MEIKIIMAVISLVVFFQFMYILFLHSELKEEKDTSEVISESRRRWMDLYRDLLDLIKESGLEIGDKQIPMTTNKKILVKIKK